MIFLAFHPIYWIIYALCSINQTLASTHTQFTCFAKAQSDQYSNNNCHINSYRLTTTNKATKRKKCTLKCSYTEAHTLNGNLSTVYFMYCFWCSVTITRRYVCRNLVRTFYQTVFERPCMLHSAHSLSCTHIEVNQMHFTLHTTTPFTLR